MENKVILLDSSGSFVPTVKVVERLKQQRAKTGQPSFIMPPVMMYFNSLISCLCKIGVNEGDTIIVAGEGKSFRKNFYAPYKAQREGLREKDTLTDWKAEFEALNRLHAQLDESTNWHFVRVSDGLEADDVIAIACRYFKDKKCVVVSGDADLKMLCYYPNVAYFNLNKKCKGTKGTYEAITPEQALKLLNDKARKGDTGDNIIVDKQNDTPEDAEMRLFLVDLLNLPPDIEQKGINALSESMLNKKQLHLDKLPKFKNVQEKFLRIYKPDNVISEEYCHKLIEKRITKKKKEKQK